MSVSTVHEDDVEGVDVPGRYLKWLANADTLGAKHCSCCVIRIKPGDKVTPAHSHPQGEEAIYILAGNGRVMVNRDISPVRAGQLVLFPQGHVHMLHNSGQTEMKVICFFSPPTSLDNYKLYPDVDFPD
jgi:uncharacterized cupin superfamily protein